MVQGVRRVVFLLDTVTISETQKSSINPALREFFASTDSNSLFLSAVTVGELHFGLNLIPSGKRRKGIQTWVEKTEEMFANRILGVDEQIGRVWGQVRADMRKSGYSVEFNDVLIAATAIHHDLTVVTRNVRHFEPTGCRTLNPWDAVLEPD